MYRISDLEEDLKKFKEKHGNREIALEYWCHDCNDTHEGSAFDLDLVNDKLELSVRHLGF